MTMAQFGKVTIIGLGLIGSSICHAAKRGRLTDRLVGFDSNAAVRVRAREIGFADAIEDDLAVAVTGADLVILCSPVGSYRQLAQDIAPHLKQGAILSDVGSVKGAVVKDVSPFVPEGVHFIPAHPIAGTEYSGPDAGFASLFDARWAIATPPPGSGLRGKSKSSGPSGRGWAARWM